MEWRALPGFPGYEVSDLGDVRSWRKTGGGTLTEPRTLRPRLHPTGYLYVAPRRDGRNVAIKNHHAVALAFIGPRPEGQEVRHLDGNRTNNRASNLQYGTRSDNMRDALKHGTHPQASKTHCPRGHEYDTRTPKGHRLCSSCMRDHRKAHQLRRKGTPVNTYTVTITVQAISPDHARGMFPGHTVTKVTAKRATAPTTTLREAGTRPDSTTDRPQGLDYLETVAYVRGYARGCMTYVRKHGIPRGDDLRLATIERDWDRHPQAHKAGLRELAKEHEARAAYRPTMVERVA